MPSVNRPDSFDPGLTTGIVAERRRVEKRLRDGEEFLRIGRGPGADPVNFARWELAWIDLLQQYERLCDQAQQYYDAAPDQPATAEKR